MSLRKNLNRKCCMIAAALLLSAACVCGCGGKAVSTEKTDAGSKALEASDYLSAENSFKEALAQNEDPVAAWRGLGIAQMAQAKNTDAVQSFSNALASTDGKMPDTVKDLLKYKITAQYQAEEYEGCVVSCGELLALDGKAVMAYFFRGASQLHLGQLQDAKANFDYAVSLRPNDYALYLSIYSAYEEMKQSGLGDAYLQTALGIAPSNTEDYYHVGRIYFYLEQYDEAANALAKPIEEHYIPAISLMGQVYLARGDYDNARATYARILEEDPSNTDAYNGLALCAIALGDPDTALNYIMQGLELPGNEGKQELYFNEIVAYEKKLDFLTARDKARRYVEMYPTDEKGQRELQFLNTRG